MSSVGDGSKKVKNAPAKGIMSLPDEALHSILTSVPEYRPKCLKDVLPLVCKKWREILYLQGVHLSPACRDGWYCPANSFILGSFHLTSNKCRAALEGAYMPVLHIQPILIPGSCGPLDNLTTGIAHHVLS